MSSAQQPAALPARAGQGAASSPPSAHAGSPARYLLLLRYTRVSLIGCRSPVQAIAAGPRPRLSLLNSVGLSGQPCFSPWVLRIMRRWAWGVKTMLHPATHHHSQPLQLRPQPRVGDAVAGLLEINEAGPNRRSRPTADRRRRRPAPATAAAAPTAFTWLCLPSAYSLALQEI